METNESISFDEAFQGWLDEMAKEIESIRESEIMTAEDYAIRINTVAD